MLDHPQRTPPLGWLSWQRYRCAIACDSADAPDCFNEGLIKRIATEMVDGGYLAAGYNYVSLIEVASSGPLTAIPPLSCHHAQRTCSVHARALIHSDSKEKVHASSHDSTSMPLLKVDAIDTPLLFHVQLHHAAPHTLNPPPPTHPPLHPETHRCPFASTSGESRRLLAGTCPGQWPRRVGPEAVPVWNRRTGRLCSREGIEVWTARRTTPPPAHPHHAQKKQ